MLQLAFSEADKQALHYERYYHPHPRVQQRMEALWLKSHGVPHHQIAQLCAISTNTLRSYLRLYQRGGVEALKQRNFHRPQSAFSAYRDTIETHVREHPPQTINEAVAMLEALTGIRRSPTQVRLFLTHLGLHRRKVGLLPAKGDPDVQEEYQKKVGATLSRSTSGYARRLFCRCGACCLRCVSWVSLVLRPVLDQSAQWATTFQCAWCAPCHHA
jgi:transposase